MGISSFLKSTHEKLKHFRRRVSDAKTVSEAIPAPTHNEKTKAVEQIELTASNATMARFVFIAMLLLLLAAFLYEIRDILIIFFVSLLFAAALDPMVDAMERRRIPRALGVLIIYAVTLLVLGFFISSLIPIVATEISELASRIQDFAANIISGKIQLPKFLEGLRPMLQKFFKGVDVAQLGNYKDILLKFSNHLSSIAGNVFQAVLVLFNGFFNAILVLVITFLMTVDESGIDKFILSLFPSRHAMYIRQKSNAIKEKMGYWLRGQVVLCFVIGLLTYIGFLIIGLLIGQPVQYAATIALLAGFTELIPYAGPFLAWLVALPIVANQDVTLILWMTGLLYVVQLLENNFIVPMVMHKAVGISPIFIMFAMFVGFSFLGVLGIVLSVPVATTVAIFVKDYAERDK